MAVLVDIAGLAICLVLLGASYFYIRTGDYSVNRVMAFVQLLLRNKKKVVLVLVAFVAAFIFLLATPARAEQVLSLEAGAAVVRGETPTLGFNWSCRECGAVRTDWEAGFELIGESRHFRDNPNVIQVHAQLVDGWKRAELGLGFYAQNSVTEYVCRFGFHLLARYRFSDRLAVQWRHSSSAGSCEPNAGRDLLTLGWQFGPLP